jgi:hypothetical protein
VTDWWHWQVAVEQGQLTLLCVAAFAAGMCVGVMAGWVARRRD